MNMEKACRLGNVEAIRNLIESAPEVINEVDEKIGWTPLYRTVICSHVEATKELLKLGANPNIKNKLGETPLHKAADSGLARIAKILLDNQADPNLQTNEGETALHMATLRQNSKLVTVLLKANANPNIKNLKLGQTPLHYAVDFGHVKLAQLMIAYDASPLIRDKCDKSPMDLAGSPEIQRVLVEPPQEQPESPALPAPQADTSQEFVIKVPDTITVTESPSLQSRGSLQGISIFSKGSREDLPNWLETPPTAKDALDLEISFGDKEKETRTESNPALLNWLTTNKLEEIYDPLMAAGYDDIELMSEQMKSNMPITKATLAKIGIEKPGHRARFLAKITDETVGIPIKPRKSLNRSQKSNVFECCSLPAPAPAFYSFPDLKGWLETINLGSLHPKFIESGYDDYEEILYLMTTDYHLTDMVLEDEVKILKMGHRQRIILKLQQDLNTVGENKKKGITVEKDAHQSACEMCIIM